MRIAFLTTDNREPHRRYDVPVPYFGPAPDALLQGFAQHPEAEVHIISCTQRPMRSPEKLGGNLWFHSLPVPHIGWLRTGYQGCIRAVRRKVQELQPDIVHGQGTERDSAIAAAFSGFPNVITIHGNMRSLARINRARPFSFLWSAALLERLILPRTDGIVCISTYTQEAVRSLARRTWIVTNAVDSSFFSIQRQPVSPPRLLCAATICGYKNQNFLIRALDSLATEIPFELVFLGATVEGDEYGREFLELVAQRPWCRHAGFVDRAGLQACLATSCALVLPSLEDNCPMAILEAAAAFVPVAAAGIGGIPDLIEHEASGLLFDPHDSRAAAAAVRRLLTEQGLARGIAAVAHQRALQRFQPGTVAARHLEIYREVLEFRNRAP